MSDYLKGKRVVNPILTSTTCSYKNVAFIDERIFPVVLTDKEGMRAPALGRTVPVEYGTERAVGVDNNVLVREKTGMLDLVLGEHDLIASVDYCEQVESMFNEESKAIRHVTNGMNSRHELIAACLVQDKKAYRTGHVKKLIASDRWVGGKGDPIGMVETGMEAVRTATGLRPNLMIVGAGMMMLLKFHPVIQATIGANERKHIITGILQDLFQIEEIVIGAPVSLPSVKAAMDKSSAPADIRGDNLMLHYVDRPQPGADSTDENEPSFGYTLCRKEMPVADKYDEADGKVKYCRYTDIYKAAVAGGDAGYLTTGINKQGGVVRTTWQVILITTITAGIALTQQRFVGVDSTPCKAGAAAFGVAEADTVTGDSAPVSVLGIITVEVGTTINRGVAVQPDAQVRTVPQSGDGRSCGIALDKTGGEGGTTRILCGV